jgi:hypothetical protein
MECKYLIVFSMLCRRCRGLRGANCR